MNCPSCGATAMLGSAQCGKCGASLLGGAAAAPSMLGPQSGMSSLGDLSHAVPGGPPDPPHTHPVEPGSGLGPPPPPPASMRVGSTAFTAPPPPPSWNLGQVGPKPGRQIQVGPSPLNQRRTGCGCLFSLLLFIGIGGAVVWGVTAAVNDVQGFGDLIEDLAPGVEANDAGDLALGVPIRGSLPPDVADDYTLVGTGEAVTIGAFSAGDTVLEVIDDGEVVAEEDDTVGTDPILRVDPAEGEVLVIRVRGFSSSTAVGAYELFAVAGAPGAVQPDSTTLGAVLEDEEARYQLTGTGEPVTVAVEGHGSTSPGLRVERADGTVVVDNTTSADVVLPAGETITIVVGGFGGLAAVFDLVVR